MDEILAKVPESKIEHDEELLDELSDSEIDIEISSRLEVAIEKKAT